MCPVFLQSLAGNDGASLLELEPRKDVRCLPNELFIAAITQSGYPHVLHAGTQNLISGSFSIVLKCFG